jgi:hypothetical protein
MSELSSQEIVADYERALDLRGEIIEIARQTGATPNAVFRASCRARVKGYRPDPLVGQITQGEITIIALLKDLIDNRFPLPVVVSDKVWVRGSQRTINLVDNNTGRNGTTQIFVKITAVG